MIRFALAFGLLAAACSPAPAPPQPEVAGPADLKALEAAHDWQNEPGEKLNADWNSGVKALLGKMSRPDAIAAIEAAGFSCIYGEAHQDYPDPMAVCSRSFATRACQMDWEIHRRPTREWFWTWMDRTGATAWGRIRIGPMR